MTKPMRADEHAPHQDEGGLGVPAPLPVHPLPIVVLQSFPVPRPTTNPYNVMLADGLAACPDVKLVYFSWRRALLGEYDVFHAHWPEILVDGHSPIKKLVRQALSLTFFLRLHLSKTAVVRTVHNLELPEGISRREVALLRYFDRITTLRIRINPTTVVPSDQPSVLIPHGHYRDWFSNILKSSPILGRIAYVGSLRRYKSVDELTSAFRQTLADAPELRLSIAGNPSSPEITESANVAQANDPRIELTLRFISDAELVTNVTSAELVVLPYRKMHNSGTVLASLSLDRPVLVPKNEVNDSLAEEVGSSWVQRFPSPLRGEHILTALRSVRGLTEGPPPDLSARGWEEGVRRHVAAYRRALSIVRGGHSSPETKDMLETDSDPARTIRVRIAILTFKRPTLLAGLLRAVDEQATDLQFDGRWRTQVDILVVDNDPEASGRGGVSPGLRCPAKYVVEPEPGIAAARDRALTESPDSDVLVFIDDDERPCAMWLVSLFSTWFDTRASAVAGRVIAQFEEPPTPWIQAGEFFTRGFHPTGTTVPAAPAGNLLLDLRQVRMLGTRFARDLGLRGGEDTLFTRSLTRDGGCIVWCAESAILDQVPRERATARWVLKRRYSHGMISTDVDLRLADSAADRLLVRGRAIAAGSAQITIGIARAGLGAVARQTQHQALGLKTAARGAGRIVGAFGLQLHEYKRHS